MLEKVEEALAHAKKSVTRCEFFVTRVELLEAAAMINDDAKHVDGPVYLRGYNISPGVELRKNGEFVHLYIWLQLHRGDLDEVVHWPFEHKIKLAILHPIQNETKAITVKTYRKMQYYRKPTESSNRSVVILQQSIDLKELKCGGYVCDDELRVVWELL